MAPALSAACAERIRRAEVARSEARRLLGQGEVYGAAGRAFEAVREALLAASAAFGVPHEEDTSLLAAAEGLSRATRFGCIPCRFSSQIPRWIGLAFGAVGAFRGKGLFSQTGRGHSLPAPRAKPVEPHPPLGAFFAFGSNAPNPLAGDGAILGIGKVIKDLHRLFGSHRGIGALPFSSWDRI